MNSYCDKEFLTVSPESSTSAVVSFSGLTTWHKELGREPLSFIEISDCHNKVRLHRTYEMSEEGWLGQVLRLRAHLTRYIEFLETGINKKQGDLK